MSNAASFKKPKQPVIWSQCSRNLVKNLLARDLGLLSSFEFISGFNRTRLDTLKLSTSRSLKQFANSITWFSIDNIDSRFLLAAKSDGSFVGVDTFQERDGSSNELKLLFTPAQRNIHSHSVSCIQWYPIDTGMFFTSGMDEKFKVWDTNTLEVVDEYYLKHKIYNHHISTQNASSAKTLTALALDNGQIRFIDLNSGSFTHTLKAHSHGYCVSVQWSPYDPNLLASAGSDGRIGLWDVRSSKSCLMYLDSERSGPNPGSSNLTRAPTAHTGAVVSLAFTPDSNHILSLGKDNKLRLWDAHNGRNTLVNYGRVALSSNLNQNTETSIQLGCTPDNIVFVPSGPNLIMFGILDGECKKTLKGHFEPITCCVHNSALNEIYSGARDRNILIWDTQSNEKNDRRTNQSSSAFSVLSTTGRAHDDNWSDDD